MKTSGGRRRSGQGLPLVFMPAFTRTGIPTDAEIKEHLANDAQTLKLAEPAQPSKIFDFSLQSDVLRELGIK